MEFIYDQGEISRILEKPGHTFLLQLKFSDIFICTKLTLHIKL